MCAQEHAGGVVPTDEELDFVLNAAVFLAYANAHTHTQMMPVWLVANTHIHQDESDGRINGQVNLHEINHALQSWIAIRQNKARVID